MTVSRVINGTIPVDNETRRRVERVIESTEYKPNLVGMLVPEVRTTRFATLIEYVEEYVESPGYNLIFGSTGGDPDRETRFFENMTRRHIDGIIISLVSDRSHLIRIIHWSEIPVGILDQPLDHSDLPTAVMEDNKAGVMAAGKDLVEQNIVEGHFDYESGKNGVDILLDRGVSFTALWAQNDLMTIGALIGSGKEASLFPGMCSCPDWIMLRWPGWQGPLLPQ